MRNLAFIITLALFTLFRSHVSAQVTIGALTPPESSAVLQLIAPNSDKGVLFPRLNTAQRDAIDKPANGLMIFNTENRSINYYCEFIGGWKSVGLAGMTEGQKGNIANQPIGETIFNIDKQCLEVWNGSKWISSSTPYTGAAPVKVDSTNHIISVATGNIVIGTSNASSSIPMTVADGKGRLLTDSSTFTVHNTAPLWNADQLQGKTVVAGQVPAVGHVLKYTALGWAPGIDNAGPTYTPVAPITINGSNQIGISVGTTGQVLTSSGTTVNWQTPPAGWLLGGNTGTTPGTDFIGTTDDKDLVFKRNGTQAGILGSSNIAYGPGAGLNMGVLAKYNAAIGVNSLTSMQTGISNTALGHSALFNATGNQNVGFGQNAGAGLTTGINNIFLGCGSGVNNNKLVNDSTLQTGNNNIIIGYGAIPENVGGVVGSKASNQVILGNAANNYYKTFASWNLSSDRRLKHNINPLGQGLSFVKQLNPVEYVYNNSSTDQKSLGFIAQEVQEAMKKANMDINAYKLVSGDEDKGMLNLAYTEFIPVLTKAIQEQQAIINTLVERIEALERK